jgi:hypothetical protein
MYPPEFRIARCPWSPQVLSVIYQALGKSLDSALPDTSGRERTTVPETSDGLPEEMRRFLGEVATNIWRLRQKMLDGATRQPLEPTRRLYRHVESIWDAFGEQGIEICDHTGQVVPQGGVYGLRILACQPTAGIGREVVLETIKPTVRLRQQVIQMGEVILAVPENTQNETGQTTP